VQLPADLSTSPLPPVETGVQVLEVAPPEGWRPSEDGSIDAFVDIEDLCARSPNDTRCSPAEDLGDEGDKENDAAGVPTGGDGNNTPDDKPKPTEEDLRKEIADQFTDLSASEVENFLEALLDIAQGSSSNELTPSQRIELLQTVGSMVKDGSISNETVQYFAGLKNATPMGELCKVPGLEFNPNPSFVAGGGLPPGAGLTGAFAIAGTLVFATPGLPDEVIMLTGIAIGYGVGTLLSQKDDPLVNPMIVPGIADFAGTPGPEDPCGEDNPEFSEALTDAISWLDQRGFKAEQPALNRFPTNLRGTKIIGMETSSLPRVGYRIEYDARTGAHINTYAGKEKGSHFTFKGDQSTVDRITRRMFQCNR
jgi:hypothetical protein